MKLVIVESPSKAKTIEKYLGKEYTVDASGGHVRDLPQTSLGVDVKNGFEPKYVINKDKKDVIKRLSDKAKKADQIYLATDPDREGEAISWHLCYALKLDEHQQNRIEFNEISPKAVKEALQHPREINRALVDAQQARRVLDRLVGYKLSPFLCKQLHNNLSAGRVQSVALRMVVEREKEIQNFVPQEYWNIFAFLNKNTADKEAEIVFRSQLEKYKNKKFKPKNKDEADTIVKEVEGKQWIVRNVKKAVSSSHAPAPFTTSTLQQDASAKLSLTSPQVMQIAQQLYEGVPLAGEGQVALVTYIRTDSVRISQDAQNAALEFIGEKYGKEYVPAKPNVYKTKKGAQDAHEAIRPISLLRTPESIKDKVPHKNIYRVYKLIYERFLASQMAEAKYNTMTVDIEAGQTLFRANGKSLLFKGFTAVYDVYKEVDKDKEDEENVSAKLPNLSEGDVLNFRELKSEQKFTKPPARYTDATLVKAMEEKGIGRPSTYASIIGVLLKRTYTVKDGKYIKPTDLAFEVSDLLIKYFDKIVDTSFTAHMEESLDQIEEGNTNWKQLIENFYPWLQKKLEVAGESLVEETDIPCDKCGAMMLIRSGKYGKFLACSNYPNCQNTKPLDQEVSDVPCDKCGAMMIVKNGRYGKYLACPNYPECQNIKPLVKDEPSDVPCDKCGKPMIIRSGRYGKYLHCADCKINKPIVEQCGTCPKCGKPMNKRRSKTGKIFYGCSGYPECDFLSWDEVSDKKCPKCGAYTVVKRTKAGNLLKCSACDYREELEAPAGSSAEQEAGSNQGD